MKLHRLRVRNFAAIRELEIAFGPGLNVLYGPNDLGKSTLADAIRLALLLPHSSTDHVPYIPWSGALDPLVELSFETEEQRFWRVRKQFGKGGSSLLQESRNGEDWDDVERARGVDARLRDILRWGIPEPGGPNASKGLPSSFLATALLSTQDNVTDLLGRGVEGDPSTTGREQIAAALQAVAQDPFFLSLLRETQERRDEAYTDKGAKKTAKGSVFKRAADRLKEARDEKERWEKIVEDSEEVEHHLRNLLSEREQLDQEHAAAVERAAVAQQLAQQAADCAAAAEQVRLAQEAVQRIRMMDHEVADAEKHLQKLADQKDQAERALKDAQTTAGAAGETLKAAEEEARSAGADSGMADTVVRQALELRNAAAEQKEKESRQRLTSAAAAQSLVDAALRAESEHAKQEADAVQAHAKKEEAARAEDVASTELRRCDLLERALVARTADKHVESARADVEKEKALQGDKVKTADERAAVADRRKAITVPPQAGLVALRKLATDLATARGALDVGLVMTIIPTAFVNVRLRVDGVDSQPTLLAKPLDIEASTEVEVNIADLAAVYVRGGRREAQEKAQALETRWLEEAQPHLTAAGVADLDALDAKIAEARDLDSRLKALDGDLESLQQRIDALAGAAAALSEAAARVTACRQEIADLGDIPFETLAAELDTLGSDPGTALRARRQKSTQAVEAARSNAHQAATSETLAAERARALRATLDGAIKTRDTALQDLSAGLPEEEATAQAALDESLAEQEKISADLASLQSTIQAKQEKLDAALATARAAMDTAQQSVAAAQTAREQAIASHAAESGRLAELRKTRAAADLPAAETHLRETTEHHDALPVPDRLVTPDEVPAAQTAVTKAKRDLETLDRDIHIAQGRLQQVGGAVARDRLREATESFELAEQNDRDTEADYEAWRLLLEQMKEADAAQASNLGQALAPAIANRFQALTRQRYQHVEIAADLKTQGVVVAGTVRPHNRISVGTREQLSTLYRLCLGEYLKTTIVLDDQLVQSDDTRMEWFRALLAEKARTFQIVVLTCRPGDYLVPEAMVGEGAVFADSEEGFVRAVNVGRAIG